MLALLEIQNLFASEIHRKDIMLKENSPLRNALVKTSLPKRCEYIRTHPLYQSYLPIGQLFIDTYLNEIGIFKWFYEKMHLDILIKQDIILYITGLKQFCLYYDTLSHEKYMETELKQFVCFYYAFIHKEVVKVTYDEVNIFYNNYYSMNDNIRQFAPDIELYHKWLLLHL